MRDDRLDEALINLFKAWLILVREDTGIVEEEDGMISKANDPWIMETANTINGIMIQMEDIKSHETL